jgi:hypothetical protein
MGEMALLDPTPTLRNAFIRANTNVTLAVLSLEDFRFVMDNYLDFSKTVRE